MGRLIAIVIMIIAFIIATLDGSAQTLSERFEQCRQRTLMHLRIHSLKKKHDKCKLLKIKEAIERVEINFAYLPEGVCGTSGSIRFVFSMTCRWSDRDIDLALLHEGGHRAGVLADDAHDFKKSKRFNEFLSLHFKDELSAVSDQLERNK